METILTQIWTSDNIQNSKFSESVFLNFYLGFESAPGSPISNYYANTTGASRSFRTMVGQIIYRCCNRAEHLACLCRANLAPLKTKKHFAHTQPHAGGCVNQSSVIETMAHCNICSDNMHPIITPGILISGQRKATRTIIWGYNYPQDYIYTRYPPASPSRFQKFKKWQISSQKIQYLRPTQDYSNVIQNHALPEQQCLVPDKLDNKTISILIDTYSSICLLDEQLYYSLPSVPQLQPIQFPI